MTQQRIATHPVFYRQATAAQLTQENPVAPVGQLVREKDTGKIKYGDGVTAYNALSYAVGVENPVDMGNVSGAVVVDASLGSVFLLTLTGNVTALSISNPVAGKRLELHFIQDGTGSRTLAGVAAPIKLTATLTLTTAAGKRDVLSLRTLGANSYEVSRAAGVAA